jgi:hypothetical protein
MTDATWEPATGAVSMSRGEGDSIRLRITTDSGLRIEATWKLDKFARAIMAEMSPCAVRVRGSINTNIAIECAREQHEGRHANELKGRGLADGHDQSTTPAKMDEEPTCSAERSARIAQYAERHKALTNPPREDRCPECGTLHYGKDQRKIACPMVRDRRGGWRQLGVYDG